MAIISDIYEGKGKGIPVLN